ncbi:Hint domain-containing protein [Thioclava sp. GXIMD2076]
MVSAVAGIAQGAQIRTLEGDLPIEYLGPGDRIVTRSGMRVLRAVSVQQADRDVLCVTAGSIGHGRPQGPLYVGARTRLRVSGWRAEALYGAAEAEIEAARLCDGTLVQAVSGRSIYLYMLHFDAPETVFAEGVEVAAATVDQPAERA